jgi:hypothetical protein
MRSVQGGARTCLAAANERPAVDSKTSPNLSSALSRYCAPLPASCALNSECTPHSCGPLASRQSPVASRQARAGESSLSGDGRRSLQLHLRYLYPSTSRPTLVLYDPFPLSTSSFFTNLATLVISLFFLLHSFLASLTPRASPGNHDRTPSLYQPASASVAASLQQHFSHLATTATFDSARSFRLRPFIYATCN